MAGRREGGNAVVPTRDRTDAIAGRKKDLQAMINVRVK
jgi:hypothetical protein